MIWRTVEPATTTVSCPPVRSRSSDGIQTTAMVLVLSGPGQIVDLQTRDPAKVREIARNQSRIMTENNGRDAQIHRAHTDFGFHELLIFLGHLLVKVQDRTPGKVLQEG